MSDFLSVNNCAARECNVHRENENENREIVEDVDLSILNSFEEAQCAGEPDLIVELIDLYLEDVPQQLSAMKNFILNADKISLKRAAHNLKGGSANLGVNCIVKLCEELEQSSFTESSQPVNDLIIRLEQAFIRVRSIFQAERQSRI